LLKSRKQDKCKYSFETKEEATKYAVLAGLCIALFLTVSALAIAGGVALAVIFSPVWSMTFAAIVPFIFVGAAFTGVFVGEVFEEAKNTMKGPAYCQKISELDNKIQKGSSAMIEFYTFFGAEESPVHSCNDLPVASCPSL
jgi:hypothetical protein